MDETTSNNGGSCWITDCYLLHDYVSTLSLNDLEETSVREDRVAEYAVNRLYSRGWAVVDGFVGQRRAVAVLEEARSLYKSGVFAAGQISHQGAREPHFRSDFIYWVNGNDKSSVNIGYLLAQFDSVIKKIGVHLTDDKIVRKSKAMLSCYPKSAHYVKHVDNPDGDGRLITCVYYMNPNWRREDGGILRLYPQSSDKNVDVLPLLDRMVFFWSDRRNPHEVTATMRERFAITVWYFNSLARST
uniref:hypoxia-inducible factor-proline dioxygenase n=1 Tax=Trichuris muris TaxID=70415 RepID=A0A5S6QUK4_TRIMR